MKKILLLIFLLFSTSIYATQTGRGYDFFNNDIKLNQTKEFIFSENIATNSIKLHIEDNKLRAKKYYNNIWNSTSIEPRSIVYIESLADLLVECEITQNTKLIMTNKVFISTDTFINPYTLYLPPGVTPKIQAAGVITQGVWVYVGTGNCFESPDIGGLLLDQIIFSGISGLGQTLFDLHGSDTSVILKFSTAIFTDFDNLGEVSSINVSWDDFQLNKAKTGIKFTDISNVSLDNLGNYDWINDNAIYYSFYGNFGNIKQIVSFINIPSKNYVYYISPTSNFSSCVFSDNNFSFDEKELGGAVFAPGSLDQKNPKIKSDNNSGLADSTVKAQIYNITTNTTLTGTAVLGIGVPTTINILPSLIIVDDILERGVVSTENNTIKWTYTGLEDIVLDIEYTAKVEPESGIGKIISINLCKNGVVCSTPKVGGIVDDNKTIDLAKTALLSLKTNDYIQLLVEHTATIPPIDVYVRNIKLSIK